MEKRDLFAELMQGVEEMAAHREGKIVLRREDGEEKQEQADQAGLIPDMADRLAASWSAAPVGVGN